MEQWSFNNHFYDKVNFWLLLSAKTPKSIKTLPEVL